MRAGLFENPSFQRPAPEEPSLAAGTLERQFADLECGRVAYLRHGSGPPLLLVHGIPTSARLWEPLLGDLGRRFDCIVPDLLGLGRSRPRAGAEEADLASPGQAAMLGQLLDALGVGDVLTAWHDQGGAHGMQFLARSGDRVRAAAFANVVCYDNWLVPAIAAFRAACQVPALLRVLASTGLAEQAGVRLWPFPQTTVRGRLPQALVDDWHFALRAGGDDLEAWRRYVLAQSPRYTQEAVPTLRGFSKPALVMWAAHDKFLPTSWGVRLAEDLAGAPDQPILLPFAGHFFHADVPRTAARVLGEFLAGVD